MTHRTPRKALSKAYLKTKVLREEIERFKSSFSILSSKIKPDLLEEELKNIMRDFLLDSYYKGKYEINVKDRKDLVIHNGPKSTDEVAVIIEAKAIKNKSEMISKDNLNAKALQEIMLYYLRERIDKENTHIKKLIVTNVHEWFIFDGNDFEKLIYRNTKLIKAYNEYIAAGHDTKYFYDTIASPFIKQHDLHFKYTWFDIREYKEAITNEDLEDDNKLIALYKLLSPTHILKLPFANDSNTLNKSFYKELLYIIGLEETKEKNKKIIQRVSEENRQPASLLENTMTILEYESNIPESERYEVSLELCIIWINRILFLKLLESQLVKYHKGHKEYKFLSHKKIENYDLLNKLFFQVLAIRTEKRRPNIQAEYKHVPYLNSSLFEVSDIEKETSIKISNLEDSETIDILPFTALKDHKHKPQKGKINTLSYLLQFLDAYDFSSEGSEQIEEENKTLINASVLGLIFEKINGYKDGSFFTPGFITMYMCKETLERAVIQKFNERKGWSYENIEDIRENIGGTKDDRIEANSIINEIKVCDPAVGSGHFLVSMLNEFIAMKSFLGVLSFMDGQRVKHYKAEVDNDELIITDEEDDIPYAYQLGTGKKPPKEMQNIQMMLFHEKKTIIENCLFGVDINPNSVKICRLRLWIELLKNAYYTEESKYTDLETLPNIDINIKCGNSLISRFDLDADLSEVFNKKNYSKDNYLIAVNAYKNENDKDSKLEIKKYLNTIKEQFKSSLYARDPRKKKLSKLRGQLNLIDNAENIGDLFEKLSDKDIFKNKAKIQKQIDRIEKVLNAEEDGKFYDDCNAFEWRFEFPEVLDDDGNYYGFDAVIGNPPWGVKMKDSESAKIKSTNSDIIVRMVDSFMFFINLTLRISHKTGSISQIIPDVFLYQSDNEKLRIKILDSYNLSKAINLGDNIFEDVARPSCTIFYNKTKGSNTLLGNFQEQREREIKNLDLFTVESSFILSLPNSIIPFRDIDGYSLLIKYSAVQLNDLLDDDSVQRGVSPDLKKAFVVNSEIQSKFNLEDSYLKPTITGGRDTTKFYSKPIDKLLVYTSKKDDCDKFPQILSYLSNFENEITCKEVAQNKHPFWSLHRSRDPKIFNKDKKIIGVITGDSISVSLDDSKIYPTDGMYLMNSNGLLSNITLIGILNSTLMTFFYRLLSMEEDRTLAQIKPTILKTLPFGFDRTTNKNLIAKIENCVLSIISEVKINNKISEIILTELNYFVFKLYKLNYSEVKVIDPDFAMSESEYNKSNFNN